MAAITIEQLDLLDTAAYRAMRAIHRAADADADAIGYADLVQQRIITTREYEACLKALKEQLHNGKG
jgi:hypothetical protein